MQELERQTARFLLNHCQSRDFLSSSFIYKHEAYTFDVQL